jgi:hypothetical protein
MMHNHFHARRLGFRRTVSVHLASGLGPLNRMVCVPSEMEAPGTTAISAHGLSRFRINAFESQLFTTRLLAV